MEKSPLRIVFFGTPKFVIPVGQKLQENFDLAGIVTAPISSAVKSAFQNSSLKILAPETFDHQILQDLTHLKPDLYVVAAYGKIIPKHILDIPQHGALNIHPSLLPKYRGASPLQSAILNGDKISGVSIIKMDEKMDHGPILFTKQFILSPKDNFDSLSNKVFQEVCNELSGIILDFIQKKLTPYDQDDTQASFCNLVKKQHGYFDINNPPTPDILDKMIRAYYPWPTAWTKWDGKVIKFLPEGMVQPEGKNPMSLQAFLNGHPAFPLKQLL